MPPSNQVCRFALLLGALAFPALAFSAQQERHNHDRFHTDRESEVELALPEEDDAFTFAIFGDRTGGPDEGVKILAEAVGEVNLLDPDLVMTVGDLINGYNQAPEWLEQMREFKGIMDGLDCPWFPVAGNHDVYWRGPKDQRPPEEHEGRYEIHFGPLWYAFEHKDAWFIVLYSDEPNPATGERHFGKPECQVMSPEQTAWLEGILERAKGAKHTFVFLHHPRWIGGGYGDDWERIHGILARAGNVRAVFAGHIHRMRFDGERDGIEYFALATTGGGQSGISPDAGFLHHYNYVTVRDEGIAMVTYPVGAAIDPRAVTGEISDEVRSLSGNIAPKYLSSVDLMADGGADGTYELEVRNPVTRSVDYQVVPDASGGSWRFFPEHLHVTLEPGEKRTLRFRALRPGGAIDASFRDPRVSIAADLLTDTQRFALEAKSFDMPVNIGNLPVPARPAREHVLDQGTRGVAIVPDARIDLPDGPFTIEGWLNPTREPGDRVGWLAKTESSEYGIFVSRGAPSISVHVGGAYAEVRGAENSLAVGSWQHVAGVFDGSEVRLYLDGALVGTTKASGARRRNSLPLMIGADVEGRGRATSHFDGLTDEVRLSKVARYGAQAFVPERRFESDADTILLLHMDGAVGPWLHDASGSAAHPRVQGTARVAEVE